MNNRFVYEESTTADLLSFEEYEYGERVIKHYYCYLLLIRYRHYLELKSLFVIARLTGRKHNHFMNRTTRYTPQSRIRL